MFTSNSMVSPHLVQFHCTCATLLLISINNLKTFSFRCALSLGIFLAAALMVYVSKVPDKSHILSPLIGIALVGWVR